MATIKNIIDILDQWAPPAYAEDFDNVGLLIGEAKNECSGILVSLDCIEKVVDEAIESKCNLIVCFHPIVFSGLKKKSNPTSITTDKTTAINKFF